MSNARISMKLFYDHSRLSLVKSDELDLSLITVDNTSMKCHIFPVNNFKILR